MNAPTLIYGRAPRRYRRLVAATLIFAAIAGTSAYRWGPRVWRGAALLYWEHCCLTYTDDSGRVVCEERADRPAAIPAGMVLERSGAGGTRLVKPPLRCFSRLAAASGWSRVGGEQVLFCHSRRGPAGEVRLVVVTRRVLKWEDWHDIDFGQHFRFYIISPGSGWNSPMLRTETGGTLDAKYGPVVSYSRRTRFFEGTADPADPSRFVIGYDMDGVPGTIEGRLRKTPYGDDILFRVISGPALDRSP